MFDPFAFNGSISVIGVPAAAPAPAAPAPAVAAVVEKKTKKVAAASPFSVGPSSAPTGTTTVVRMKKSAAHASEAAATTAAGKKTAGKNSKGPTAEPAVPPPGASKDVTPLKSALKKASQYAEVAPAASPRSFRGATTMSVDALHAAALKLIAPPDAGPVVVVPSPAAAVMGARDADDVQDDLKRVEAQNEAKKQRAERIKVQLEEAKAALKLRQKQVSVREPDPVADTAAAKDRLFGSHAAAVATAPAPSPAVNAATTVASSKRNDDDNDDDSNDEPAAQRHRTEHQAAVAANVEMPPEDITTFLHPRLVKVLDIIGVTKLTRVQRLAWYPMLSSSDVLVRSETGSGKTLAYGLPMIHALLTRCDTTPIERASVGTVIIVMAPTRELSEQCSTVLTRCLQKAAFIVVGAIHGGEDKHKEKARLRKGITILVCTPGRLLDHVQNTASFGHDNLHTVVMDEADRLLDMGFERTIGTIMQHIRPKKRVLVSATITPAVERLSYFALQRPIRVGETEDKYEVPSSLRQHFVVVPCKHRLEALTAVLLSQLEAAAKKMVVFVSTSDATEFLYLFYSRLSSPFERRRAGAAVTRAGVVSRHAAMLAKRTGASTQRKLIKVANKHLVDDGGANAADDAELPEFAPETGGMENMIAAATSAAATASAQRRGDATSLTGMLSDDDALLKCNVFKLHGNMTQTDRTAVFNAFRDCERGVLFCTDVAARGLDMPSISWIVHYDPPSDDRCYIHRVGRTARIGNSGDSVLFLMEHEKGFVDYLNERTKTPMKEKSLSVFMYHLARLDSNSGGGASMWADAAAKLQRAACSVVRHDDVLSRVAMFAYRSQIRAYSAYPREVKPFFNPAELHLGHLAAAFAIDATPSEMKHMANKYSTEDRNLGRDQKRFKKDGETVQLDTRERYRSSLATKASRSTKDFVEAREASGDVYRRISSNAKAEFEA